MGLNRVYLGIKHIKSGFTDHIGHAVGKTSRSSTKIFRGLFQKFFGLRCCIRILGHPSNDISITISTVRFDGTVGLVGSLKTLLGRNFVQLLISCQDAIKRLVIGSDLTGLFRDRTRHTWMPILHHEALAD